MRAEKVRYLLLILLITCQRKIQMTTPQSVIFYEYLKKKMCADLNRHPDLLELRTYNLNTFLQIYLFSVSMHLCMNLPVQGYNEN